jgi:DNA-3-methyladenine glycosylase
MTPATACKRLGKDFYDFPCRDMATKLLGKLLCCASANGVMKGRIVETEMYPGMSDPASHSYEGKKTSRNSSMFKEPGTAYVYSIYGMYYCFNISSQGQLSLTLTCFLHAKAT